MKPAPSAVTVERFADLAARIRAAPARLGPVRLVAVDGPAGAGKTTFAGRLANALRDTGATIGEIHTDDLLDGWGDMLTFWPRFDHDVLQQLRSGRPGCYRRYDWYAGRFAEAVPVPVPDVLLVEGVTSARAVIRADLTLSVFIAAPRDLRLARGLARDGEELESHLARWFAAEETHFDADRTADHADLLVDGAPDVPLDSSDEYLRKVPAGGASEQQ
jgi:uridine kinase